MLRSAELSKADTEVSLLFSEPDSTFEGLLGELAAEMDRPGAPGKHRHIYVELPPGLLYHDVELEEWLQLKPDWRSSFAGLISEEAHFLNLHYRGLYEEFSRASQSAVILARSQENREELPVWVENRLMDFGKHVEVYEDDLWPRSLVQGSVEGPQHRSLKTLTEFQQEYEELEMPISLQEIQKIELLFRQILQGDFGTIWGAEVMRIVGPTEGDALEVVGLSLTPHAIYQWRAKPRARCLGLSQQISLFSVVGVGLEKNNLIQGLRALQLLVDS